MTSLYPIMLNLADQAVGVIGGGQVAARKIKTLNLLGIIPVVVSPQLNPQINRSQIKWIADTYHYHYVQDLRLLLACTDNRRVNHQIRLDASSKQIVNNVSDQQDSDFFNMATIVQSDLVVTVSTRGHSPARAKQVKQVLERLLQQQKL